MNSFFDYIFYRLYIQYENWREDYPYTFAEGVIVVIQAFIVLSISVVLSSLNILPRKIESHRLYAIISLVVLYGVNHLRYSKKHLEIIETYKSMEDPNKKRNGILIVVFIIIIITFPMAIGILRNNYGYNI